MGEDGEVVRRRTIITLGPRTGSTGSINVTLMSNGSQTDLLRGTEVTEQKRPSSLSSMPITTKLFITEPEIIRKDRKETQKDEDENGEASLRPNAASNTRSSTVSAFNARRTIEQRRQHQAQQQQVFLFYYYYMIIIFCLKINITEFAPALFDKIRIY